MLGCRRSPGGRSSHISRRRTAAPRLLPRCFYRAFTAMRCRIRPYSYQGGACGAAARRQRRAPGLARPRPSHAGPKPQCGDQAARTAGRPVLRASVALAPDCPSRGPRVSVAPCGRVAARSAMPNPRPGVHSQRCGACERTEQTRPQQVRAGAATEVLGSGRAELRRGVLRQSGKVRTPYGCLPSQS